MDKRGGNPVYTSQTKGMVTKKARRLRCRQEMNEEKKKKGEEGKRERYLGRKKALRILSMKVPGRGEVQKKGRDL